MDKEEEKESKKKKKAGRPPKVRPTEETVDEKIQDRLDMADRNQQQESRITIDEVTKKWNTTFQNIAMLDGTPGIGTVAAKWNKLNPFLQNARIKNIYTQAKKFDKSNISEFLQNPGNNESQLRGLSWASSSQQQIYYNILRRSCDIPLYNYYITPDLFEASSDYKKDEFKAEDGFVQEWIEKFNIKNTFKTIALEVKREGKSSYLLRNRMVGAGKNKHPVFCTLQKLPTEWVKITGKGQLGYTVSFNMLYFLDIANSPSDYGDFIINAWNDMIQTGVVLEDDIKKTGRKYSFNIDKAKDYHFVYENKDYKSAIEAVRNGREINYMFWLRMPYDICYTFGSDNSHPWVAPDTMGLMLKLQELTDYGQLAGLIASTPLTAVLTGEIETIPQPRAGKNESVYSPEVLRGYMEQFNQATSTNVEAWLWPAKNIKLQQLSSDVNSSEIISTSTQNFLESAGEGGLTIATEKPNVAQIVVAKQLAASQQHYVTLQFEQVLNFILQCKLGLKYKWKISLWGDIFNIENDRKFLKEIVSNGNMAFLPKLLSAEGLTLRDTKAIVDYIKSLDFYKDFSTYTQIKSAELLVKNSEVSNDQSEEQKVGRPAIGDDNIENENTAASRDQGTNTSENRI